MTSVLEDGRVLPLEGVHNFRDYGGYAAAGGGRLRRGLLWRSGQHFGASEGDLARIDALGLASVFDLRTSRERQNHPCRRPHGFAAEIYHSDDPTGERAPHIAAAASPIRERTAQSTRESMRQNYHRIAFRPELIAMMRQQMQVLAAGKGPSLVNCMAGKDRTGIAVAMVQLACGVHRDDVLADYLLTNRAGDVDARIAAGMETIRASTGKLDADVLRVLMGVEAEYLENAFAAIRERHGSVDGYLRDVLGVDDGLKVHLIENLVEA